MTIEIEQNKKPKLGKLIFLLSIILFGIMIALFLWPKIALKKPSDIIIVKGLSDPIKVKLINQGGAKVPHQELQVIDLLRDGSKQAEGFETLRPSESLPEPPPILGDEKQNVLSQNKIML